MRAILLSAAALALAICQISLACGSAPLGCDQALAVHAPIRIDSDADFTPANGVTGGSGTEAEPWIIEGWDISGALHAFCIYVGNTTLPFEIRSCRAHNASGNFVSYFYTESGIIFYNVTGGSVTGSVAESNEFDGISLYNSTHCDVSGNAARWNEYGISLMEGSANNSVDGNAALDNGYYGIGLFRSNANLLSGNTVFGSPGPGISLSESTGNTVERNAVCENNNGIELWESSGNTLASNGLRNNTNGICLEYSDSNDLLRNNVSDNRQNGIILSSSTGNAIWQNRLANNTMAQAMDGSGGNAWDGGYPAGGNWWGDYVGQDADRDGFGDTPYFGIWGGMGARDRYPLMLEWFDDTEAPTADAGPDISLREDQSVTFNGTASHDNVGIVNYTWQFSVGQARVTLHNQLAAYNFTEPGIYSVTLNVTDSAGNLGTDSLLADIKDVTAPVANAGPDCAASKGEKMIFNGSGSSDNVGIVNFTWSLECGQETIALWGICPTHEFQTAGIWTASLSVRDSAGLTGTDEMLVTVTADTIPPAADAGADCPAGPGFLIKFNGTGSSDNVGIANYTWNFTYNGTAVFLYGPEPEFRFWTPGNYTLTLNVRDGAGNIDSDTVMVHISDWPEEDVQGEGGIADSATIWLIGIAVTMVITCAAILFIKKRH